MRRPLLLISLAVVAATWFTWLRPVTLGGDVSYVIVDGSSMEPTYEDGDLVLVREVSDYEYGDVIAFLAEGRLDDAPMRVIHRIVGDAAEGGFLTQGDNRPETDPWNPTPDEILGRATLHVPLAGDVATFVSRPETMASLGGAAVLGGSSRRRRRRRRKAQHEPAAQEETAVTKSRASTASHPKPVASRTLRHTQPRWAFMGLIACVLAAIPVFALTWSALRAPDSTERVERIGAIDYGIGLDYRFTGEPSPVYPTGVVEATRNPAGVLAPTGPLYARLLTVLDLTIGFRSSEQGADRLTSTFSVDVDVITPGGWTTALQAIEPERFDGSATETISVDLRSVAQQVDDVAQLTGVGGGSFTIAVTPTLDVAGGTATTSVDEQLTAPMTFDVEGDLIAANALEMSDSQELTRTFTQRADYAVGPYEMRTQTARAVLSGLALVVVAGIGWFASVLFGGVGLGEPARIAARYRSQIVDVAAATAPPGPVVMVGGIDELARIAKVEQSVILHEDLGDGAHRYRVFLGSVTYEYETAPEHAGAAAEGEIASDAEETGG